jgi:hypothetical protein
MKRIIYIMLLLTAFISCKKKDEPTPEPEPTPIADFSYSISSTTPGQVIFTNLSQNYSGSSWNFGNGMASNEASPTKVFTQGTYTVALTINQGVTSKKTIQIDDAYYLTCKGYTAHTVSGSKGSSELRIATRRLTNDLGGYNDSDFNFDITLPATAKTGDTYTVSTVPNPLWFHYYFKSGLNGGSNADFQNGTSNGYLKVTNISATEVSGTFSCNLSGGPGLPPNMTEGSFKAKLN